MSQRPPSPFPKELPNGSFVVDERCTCSHLRSQHEDSVAFGHGRCADCPCSKFTWEGHVFKPGPRGVL